MFNRFQLVLAAALTLLPPLSRAQAQTNTVPEDPRVTTARQILADYQAGAPRNHRVLHVAYFCPADRTPAPDYQARLGRVLGDISKFYATQLQSYGLPSDGIPLDYDATGNLVIHLVKGTHPAADYSEAKSADEIYQDVEKVMTADGINLKSNHCVVFTRLGNYDGTNTSHNSPYCGTGNSHSGFCWQFDSDLLDTRQLLNTNDWVTDHQYGHLSIGRYNTIFIGGTAHELGHLFGLPHNAGTATDYKTRGHALMGEGNRHYAEELRGEGKGSYLTLAHALRIAANPVFSHVDKGLDEPWHTRVPTCHFEPAGRTLKVAGSFESSQPIYGVVLYVDPAGGSDYDAVSYAGTLGPDHTFTFDLADLPARVKTGEIRLLLLCASGQHLNVGGRCQARFNYTIGTDGLYQVVPAPKRTPAGE